MPDRLAKATHALVARFQRQRPIRAGSLLITIFGDAVAPRGGVVTLGSLIQLAQPFGITERLVRTSVGRLAQDGWLDFRRSGRQSEYFLTAQGRSRFAEATQRIYSEAPDSWDGAWTLILLPAGKHPRPLSRRSRSPGSAHSSRQNARDELRWLGFGQLSAGVLAHPSRSVEDTRDQLAALRMDGGAVVLQARTGSAEADRALLESGWDLAELSRGYLRFVASFEPVANVLRERARPAPDQAFIIRTLLIHEYRKIHLRDPLLPRSLLPAEWVGSRAYQLCRDLYREVFAPAEAHVTSTASTLEGALPAPSADTYRRFGGLQRSSGTR